MSKFDGFDDYRTDQDYESGKGIVLDLGQGRMITIHRAGGSNYKYIKAVTAASRKYRNASRIDPEIDNKVMAELYATTIVTGWEGICINGEPVPCTAENVKEFLLDVPLAFERIKEAANEASNFLVEQAQEDSETLGNS